ncbi:transposase (fragment) [Mesorhizobium sp. STM 4661]
MLGFKAFPAATATLGGIEMIHRRSNPPSEIRQQSSRLLQYENLHQNRRLRHIAGARKPRPG